MVYPQRCEKSTLASVWQSVRYRGMTTEGNVIHYGYIEDFIEDLGTKYNITRLRHCF